MLLVCYSYIDKVGSYNNLNVNNGFESVTLVKKIVKEKIMLLKIGNHELNEDLSMELFLKMVKWRWENFGQDLGVDECQDVLNEYEFVIDWVYHKNKEFGCELIHFFITVKNPDIIKTKLDDVGYYEFEFMNVVGKPESENEINLLEIVENSTSEN